MLCTLMLSHVIQMIKSAGFVCSSGLQTLLLCLILSSSSEKLVVSHALMSLASLGIPLSHVFHVDLLFSSLSCAPVSQLPSQRTV